MGDSAPGSWLAALGRLLFGPGSGNQGEAVPGERAPTSWSEIMGGAGGSLSSFRIPESYRREIVAHAREGRPQEVCGLIAGEAGRPVKLFRTTNNDPSPNVRYNVDPTELLAILREIDEKGWSLLAIYHSHPASEAYPSATDISLAFYPEAVYIITSLADEPPPVRAFQIIDRTVHELALEVEQN